MARLSWFVKLQIHLPIGPTRHPKFFWPSQVCGKNCRKRFYEFVPEHPWAPSSLSRFTSTDFLEIQKNKIIVELTLVVGVLYTFCEAVLLPFETEEKVIISLPTGDGNIVLIFGPYQEYIRYLLSLGKQDKVFPNQIASRARAHSASLLMSTVNILNL